MIDVREESWKQFAPARFEDGALVRAQEGLKGDGYFRRGCDELRPIACRLALTVKRLVEKDIPAPFLFLFDETWECFALFKPFLSHLLGADYRILPGFWAWHVGPGERGWPMHRDRGKKALAPDGSPLALTLWVPLTGANEVNSCVHMVPKCRDRTYGTDREEEFDFDPTAVDVLTAKPGEILCWDQAVLHWGSEARHGEPRISMALEFQRGDVEPFDWPLLKPSDVLPFGFRLKLVAKQLLQYRHMSPLGPDLEAWAKGQLEAKP